MTLPPTPALADVRLVVTDMDGTLLDPDGRVPDGLWPVLAGLHDAGITFVPASGRQHATIAADFPPATTPHHADLVVIAENGTYVTHGGHEIFSDAMTHDDVTAVVQAVRRIEPVRGGAVLAGKRSAYVERADAAFVDHVRTYYAELEVVDDLTRVDDQFLKVAVYDDVDSATGTFPALAHLQESLQVVVSSPHWVDVMNPGVTKGVALRRLQQLARVGPEQTMVFGDYLNDLEMLDVAHWSYAMAGAHPDVIARARYVAPSNAEHGVVQVLQAMLRQHTTERSTGLPDGLLEAVEAHYAAMDVPSWPSPRPDGAPATAEDYERVTDPERYRVAHARARAWAAALAEVPGITVEELGPDELADTHRTGRLDRGVRIVRDRPGTLPLLLGERDATTSEDGRPLVPILQISLLRFDLELETQPDCGCDACDFGSDGILEAVDETVVEVLRGPYAIMRGPHWHAYWNPQGGGAGGGPRRGHDLGDLRERCHRLAVGDTSAVPRDGEGHVSAPWFTAPLD